MKIYLALLLTCCGLYAQPSLPVMTRQYVWIQPNPTNVGGYTLTWGTNKLQVAGVTNTTATIKLDPGINEIVLRAAGTNGILSDPVTNKTRILQYTLECLSGTNGWKTVTNFTYAIDMQKGTEIFRTKLGWLIP